MSAGPRVDWRPVSAEVAAGVATVEAPGRSAEEVRVVFADNFVVVEVGLAEVPGGLAVEVEE